MFETIENFKKTFKFWNETVCAGGLETYGRKIWQQHSVGRRGSVRILHVCRVGYPGSSSSQVFIFLYFHS